MARNPFSFRWTAGDMLRAKFRKAWRPGLVRPAAAIVGLRSVPSRHREQVRREIVELELSRPGDLCFHEVLPGRSMQSSPVIHCHGERGAIRCVYARRVKWITLADAG